MTPQNWRLKKGRQVFQEKIELPPRVSPTLVTPLDLAVILDMWTWKQINKMRYISLEKCVTASIYYVTKNINFTTQQKIYGMINLL